MPVMSWILRSGFAVLFALFVQTEHARANCKGDYARFCWHVIPGDGRIFRCLKRRLPELSPACRAQFESLPRV